MELNSRFRANKLKSAGAGIACLTIDGHDAVADAEKLPVLLKANRMFKYSVSYNPEGTLNFSPERLMGAAEPGETWTFRLYVMTNDGKYIETSLDVTKPAAEETPAPTEAPAATPEATPAATEEPVAPAAAKDGNGGATAAIIAVAVVLIGAEYLFFRRKKSGR